MNTTHVLILSIKKQIDFLMETFSIEDAIVNDRLSSIVNYILGVKMSAYLKSEKVLVIIMTNL